MQHSCVASTVFTVDPGNSVIKRLCSLVISLTMTVGMNFFFVDFINVNPGELKGFMFS